MNVDDCIRRISEAGDDIIQVQPNGSSLLHSFSMLGNYEIVLCLWNKGCRPSIVSPNKCTLLHCTVRTYPPNDLDTRDAERAKILKFYFSSGRNWLNSMPVNHKNKLGWTALKLASRLNLEKCVEVLLENGADTRITDDEGYSPLHNGVANPSYSQDAAKH